jgi:site-specific DNA-cytosine methylase
LKVLVACEFSGIVRDAFLRKGHEAYSVDFIESESYGPHIQGDVRDVLNLKWELMIAHPPCTYLSVSGARWFKDRLKEQEDALEFVRELMDARIPKICVENPISVISSKIRKPDQIIQPWMFGHGETKATCLWLKNLPKLTATNPVEGREERVFFTSPSPDRWKKRSRTYLGIAEAMADQWT